MKERTLAFTCDRDGARLDAYLAEVSDLTRSRVASLIGQGMAMVNGRPAAKAGFKLVTGDRVELRVPPALPSHILPEETPLSILYEDEDLLVVEKPVGMVVHPAPGHRGGTLVNALLARCDGLSGIGGIERPGIVHRLDKDTSGVLVIAKNDASHIALSTSLAQNKVLRVYLALVKGKLPAMEGRVDAPIGRHPRQRQRMAVVAGGRDATTLWQALAPVRDGALVACRLITGRTHQIRVHMASIGHPVVGDPVYGGGKAGDYQRLHAWRLGFDHPRTRTPMHFSTSLPDWCPPMEQWIWWQGEDYWEAP